MKITVFVGVIVATLAGCASVNLPSSVESPVGKIAAAQERTVEDNPQAQLHLQLANDAIEEAGRLAADDNERGAKLALMRANADADLALAMLRQDATRAEVEDVQGQIKELEADMEDTK